MHLCEKKKWKRKEIHTYVVRGRDISLGIREFTIWCEFYSIKKKIYYRRRGYIIEGEDKNKEKRIIDKTLFMSLHIFFLIKLYLW